MVSSSPAPAPSATESGIPLPRWLRRPGGTAGAAVGVAVVFLLVRYWLAITPRLSETYYDEALTGLMGLAILRGLPQVFYWGEPYGGADGDAYLAAVGFWLFGASTLVLRMAGVAVAVLWAWAVGSMARRILGNGGGLLAALLIAVPPVFLSYVQLSSQGEGVAMTLGTLALAAAARLADSTAPRRGEMAAWALLGLAGGLGWWASQMMAMCLAAAVLGLIVARRRLTRELGAYVAVALFAAASLPFWIWNWQHDWVTFRHFAGWGPPLPDFATRLAVVGGTLLATLLGAYWDGHALRLGPPVEAVGWLLVGVVYLPAVGLAGAQAARWVGRLWRRERPWQAPLDLVVLAFWLTVAAHIVTAFGSQGILRYAITFYATLPLLCVVWLRRLGGWLPAGRTVAAALGAVLLGYNLLTHVLFVRESDAFPRRLVDAAIARLQALGVRACYADSRIAQVITFESGERVVCADYYGLRNFALLQAVDAVDDPAAVAIVTHRALQDPHPDVMADTLRLMGAEAERDEVGDYVIFHHVRPPDPRLRPIPPADWRVHASAGIGAPPAVFDRRVWTRWHTSKVGGESIELDLGRAYRLAQLTLEAGPFPRDGPAGLRVETSPDGRIWDAVAEAAELLPGVHWWKGHPRVDGSGRVFVRLPARPVRWVRFVQIGHERAGPMWSLGEIFAYEAADVAWTPAADAAAAYAIAARELARWMDDPWGPHPQRTPASYAHRLGQVRWAAVFDAVSRALELEPEWEAAHHLYASALALWQWSGDLDVAIARARAAGAWRALIPWATQADAEYSGFWRSGRMEARLEALDRLGRRAEADALRIEAPGTDAAHRLLREVHARFDNDIELVGVGLPAAVHRGERAELHYAWRAVRRVPVDFTAFVHIGGLGRQLINDHSLGGNFGTSWWAPGERTQETLPLVVPPDTPPGAYRVEIGVWRPETRRRARVTDTALPHGRFSVVVGTLTVTEDRGTHGSGVTTRRSK